MTPKEKAKELVEWSMTHGASKEVAKLFAIKTVDEILIIQEYWGGIINNFNYKYWQEVKQEIENL